MPLRWLLSAILTFCLLVVPVQAQERRILATVNDAPVTAYDVTARLNLWKLLGRAATGDGVQKQALESIIDDYARIEETRKAGAQPSKQEIDERLGRVATNLKTDRNGLKGKLKAQGITMSTLELYVSGQIAFTRLVFGKYKEKVSVDPAEVDAKLAEITRDIDGRVADMKRQISSDPRMKGLTIYKLMEISFPIDKAALSDALLSSRFVEAGQFMQRFKGCNSARSAAQGIFNVRVGKVQPADARKLPPAMKSEFEKRGVGRAIGPFRSQDGIQVWAFCGKEVMKPKLPQLPQAQYPSREQVENVLFGQRVADLEKKYASKFRDSVIVEYRE